MRKLIIVLWLLLGSASALAQVSIGIGIGVPGVSIGINIPVYPRLVRVPGHPVYYAPGLQANFFFYDGMYWVYRDDTWYASAWYNGPWSLVAPEIVPLFVLRVPVRYYRSPPVYFRGWRPDAAPHWGEHWGHDWEQRRDGWNRRNRGTVPPAAPPPVYQRKFPSQKYPPLQEQPKIHGQNYRYQPRDPVVRQHYQEQIKPAKPVPPRQGQPDRRPSQGQERSR